MSFSSFNCKKRKTAISAKPPTYLRFDMAKIATVPFVEIRSILPTIAIVGCIDETKTHQLIRNMLYALKDDVSIFTAVTDKISSFEEIMPQAFIEKNYYGVHERKIETLMKKGDLEKEDIISCYINDNYDIRQDCMKVQTETLLMNNRFYKIVPILALYNKNQLSLNMILNIQYMFITCTDDMSLRQSLYSTYGGCFPSFQFFSAMMEQQKDGYIVIDVHEKEAPAFWYKIDWDMPAFELIMDAKYWSESRPFLLK
jgi:hypothetical protein